MRRQAECGARRAAAAAALLCLAGCASTPVVPAPETAPDAPDFVAQVLARARALVGTPYRYGGDDPAGLDCSGLVQHVFGEAGVATPRTAEAQQQAALRVDLESLAPGDLVFFRLPQPHVGIYLGNGEFVHAPGEGRAVAVARLAEPYFLLGFSGGGRYRP